MFVVVAAILILTVTTLIGKHLKNKVEKAEENAVELTVTPGLQTERHIEETAIYDEYSPTVFGSAIRVSDYLSGSSGKSDKDEDEEESERNVIADVDEIAQYYDTFTINISDKDGELIYQSSAMCELTHIKYAGESKEETIIRTALDEAKEKELRTCALLVPVISDTTLSGAATIESALISELYEMGFDEVLFDLTSFFPATVDYDTANRVRTFIRECSSLSENKCKLGILLSSDAFLDSSNAKQIQLIANSASFIAVWFDLEEVYITTNAFNDVSNAVTSLLGNFSVYNMRVMIDSRFELISGAVYVACTSHGVNNVSFSSFIDPANLTYADLPGDPAKKDETEEKTETSNPYAATKDNPSIGANDRTDSDEQTDHTDYQTDEDDTSPKPWY